LDRLDRSLPCPALPVERELIASGDSSSTSDIIYIDLADNIRSVLLILTGTLPASISLYRTVDDSSEAQAKFGNIGISIQAPGDANAAIADQGFIWTRRTYYQCPPCSLPRKIRLSLKTGLAWILYDSGER
jgi:hypothetical protein